MNHLLDNGVDEKRLRQLAFLLDEYDKKKEEPPAELDREWKMSSLLWTQAKRKAVKEADFQRAYMGTA